MKYEEFTNLLKLQDDIKILEKMYNSMWESLVAVTIKLENLEDENYHLKKDICYGNLIELREENNRLNEENTKLNIEWFKVNHGNADLIKENRRLKSENCNLRYENESLKEQLSRHEHPINTISDTEIYI